MSFRKSSCVRLNFERIRNTHFFVCIFCPTDVIVHRQEDDSIFELFRSDPVLCHLLLDITKQLQ